VADFNLSPCCSRNSAHDTYAAWALSIVEEDVAGQQVHCGTVCLFRQEVMTHTIVALSDTHEATLRNFPKALHDALASADLIVHAGDHTAMSLLEELRAIGRVTAVAGNMDSTAVKVSLPSRQLFTFAGKTVGVVHGSGPPWGIDGRVRKLFPENPDLIIFGHSHVPFAGIVDGSYMVNPGQAKKSYAVITVGPVIEARIVPL